MPQSAGGVPCDEAGSLDVDEPQLEKGYIRIANELYRAVICADISKRELRNMLAIIDKTYGYGKKEDDMTMTQLAKATGLARSHCSEAVHGLAAKNMILIRDGKFGKVIGIVKNPSKWNLSGVPKTGQSQNGTRPKTGTRASQNGINSVPNRDHSRTESGHTKDNPKRQLQKTIPKDSCAAPTAPVWQAYSTAYENRYGVLPTRNAKVNGQLAQFVQRVPADEAPDIAAFYVTHNAGFYVRCGHAVGGMLSDAEKLRTEWATSTRITDTAARQSDQTQAQGDVWHKLIREAERNAS